MTKQNYYLGLMAGLVPDCKAIADPRTPHSQGLSPRPVAWFESKLVFQVDMTQNNFYLELMAGLEPATC